MSFSDYHSPYTKEPVAQDDLDLSTYSNYREIRTEHIHLDWTIDWTQRVFHGSAELRMLVTRKNGVDTITLDESYLDVKGIKVDGAEVKYEMGERKGVCGREMKIHLGKTKPQGQTVKVLVDYSTTKECTAVGWLEPVQTKSGKYPYLYSQCQAIHARSMLPCQDTPAVKSTYSAKVKSKLPALMSGLRKSPPPEEPLQLDKEVEYVYDQPVAIPTYLIAIASGELTYKQCEKLPGRNWTSGIWTEPLMMDAAYAEFAEDTPKFVATAEDITSEYRFGVYDMLFLPESFPYGGMENSCLTFATPTVIAGDKSAVDLAAHEIGHSWFGNGIGCASWSHFWLNEGWTTYLERLLIREMHGEDERQLSYIVGRRAVKMDLQLNNEEPRWQRLVTGLKWLEDPDDSYTKVPYEKGSNFLLHLERAVGGLEHFSPYIKDYVNTFQGTSITTSQWKEHLFEFFGKQSSSAEYLKKLGQVDFDEWLYGSGEDFCVDIQYDQTLAKPCSDLAAKWDKARSGDKTSFSKADIQSFSTTQKLVFLDQLEAYEALPPKLVAHLADVYGIGNSDNAEIALRFYQVALKSGPEYAEAAAKWVINKGRMKFCRPIFRLLYKQTPDLARKTFTAHREFYHPIARKMIAKDLGLDA